MVNMTQGNIPKHLIKYSIPLILGNLFQLTYNAVDSIIVGRFAGKESLAAVGTANPIMNIVIFFIIGVCMGASVLMSEFFGANELEKLRREVATTITFGFAFTVALSVVGALLSRPILQLMRVPSDILASATSYLQIIFFGLSFTFFYNVFAAALRSIGDSKTPIIFLAISSVLNASLDLVFVAALHMDVVGAALATIIAEAVSAILCIVYVYRKVPLLRIAPKELRIDRALLGKTIHYGWATAMQQTCLHVGKLLVQAAINPLGVDVIATFNAVNRVDDFAFTPEQSISHGITTFVAQNRGAKQNKRIMRGFRIGMLLEVLYWVFIFCVTYFAARPIMSLFAIDGNSQIIDLGENYLQLMALFYLLPAFTNGIQGFFRGMGKMRVTLMATTVQIVFRVLFVYLLAPSYGIVGVAYACFIGWVAMLLAEVPCYFALKKASPMLDAKVE